MKNAKRWAIELLIVFCYLIAYNTACASDQVAQKPVPKWVVTSTLPKTDNLPEDQVVNGIYYLLIDKQTLVPKNGPPEYFEHSADHIMSQTGVTEDSQINLSYDKSYQKLVLHTLQIIRNGEVINKIHSARMKLLERENEMQSLIYTGRTTLNIILDDIRVGDTIEYSYSIIGMNPVYNNIFAYQQQTNWSQPVGKLFCRLLWHKNKPIYHSLKNSDLTLTKRKISDGTEYLLEGTHIEPVPIESGTPVWFSPWGSITFSELNDWKAVARWGLSLYKNSYVTNVEIKALAEDIKKKHIFPEDQIIAALNFVQDEIRYLGIEFGQNSHIPTPADQSLKNRYGDCKDKTVLLITILNALGVKAYPALVNTSLKLNTHLPTTHEFDHVITYVKHNGTSYWLDPTLSYQHGSLEHIHQPNYHYALILTEDTTSLTEMSPRNTHYGMSTKDTFTVYETSSKHVGELSIYTEYYGKNAESQRLSFSYSSLKEKEKNYLTFTQQTYPSASIQNALKKTDNPYENAFYTQEEYYIKDIWEHNEEEREYQISYYPYEISSRIAVPTKTERKQPLAISYPDKVTQQFEFNFVRGKYDFDYAKFVEDNPFFYFSHEDSYDQHNNKLTTLFTYEAKTDHINPSEYPEYVKSLKRIESYRNGFVIREGFPLITKQDLEQVFGAGNISDKTYSTLLKYDDDLFGIALVALLILIWIFADPHKLELPDQVFFPVSKRKFIVMWISTLGLYGMYWFYKNFQYIKRKEQNKSMPLWRGIFCQFWYYSLWRSLRKDSLARFQQKHLPNQFFAICLSVIFFILVLLNNLPEKFAFYLECFISSLILLPISVLPLVSYIARANGKDSPALKKHSAWGLPHLLLALVYIAIFYLAYA